MGGKKESGEEEEEKEGSTRTPICRRNFFMDALRESGSERPFLEKKNFISGNKNFVDRRLFVYIKCKIFLAASPKK